MSHNFDAILDALKGETILVQPRVSRETIIYVLKEHTEILMSIQSDVGKVKETAVELKAEAAENRKAMIELNYSVAENKKSIQSLDSRATSMQEEISALKSKINEVNELRQLIKEQRQIIDDLRVNYENFKTNTTEFTEHTKDSIDAIDKKSNDTQFETKELRHIVDHFGDNLILSSTQITVESSAGFSKRPQALLDVLKTCQGNMSTTEKTLTDHGAKISENSEAISTKADATVAFAVQTLDKDVLAIKTHLKKEEDQGISAIRRACDTLTVQVEGLQAGLIDKIDRNVAELIVQKKYEDIVQYLQDALEASSEDEDNFKNIAAELEEKLKKLASTKSDRLEIQPIQESLVKAEASIAKLMGQSRDSGKSADVYTRDQINELLDYKVDKAILEELVNQVIKGRRKRAGNADPNTTMTDSRVSTGAANSGGNKVVSAREEQLQTTFPPTVGKDKKGGSGFPNSTPGVFRAPSEAGRAGGAGSDPLKRPSRSLMSSSMPASSMYSGTGYRGVPAGGFPPANGAIALNQSEKDLLRSQSGDFAPHATLPVDMDDVSRGSDDNDQMTGDRRHDARLGSPVGVGGDYSHLGAVMKGGGFNTRVGSASGNRPPSVTALSEAHSRSNSPVPEGKERMIQGIDGNFYLSDEPERPQSPGGSHVFIEPVVHLPPDPAAEQPQ